MNATAIRALAQALCSCGLPPCQVHREQAEAAVDKLRRAGWSMHQIITVTELPPLNPERDRHAEMSRLDAENLRRRVPPIQVTP
jgi:hypothetical protein